MRESIPISIYSKHEIWTQIQYSPQKGIPEGIQVPFSAQIFNAGPNSSNPLSHEYVALVPDSSSSVLKVTVECAGAPGKPHPHAERKTKK